MPFIRFTHTIQRHVRCPDREVDGGTVAEALAAYFGDNPVARSYVLDDRGGLRHHMAIFVDGAPLTDRQTLSDAVSGRSTVDVWQAVSGG